MATIHPIRQWLRRNECSQRQLAASAGIDPASLSRHLSGQRRLSVEAAKAVRDATGLSLDAIYASGARR